MKLLMRRWRYGLYLGWFLGSFTPCVTAAAAAAGEQTGAEAIRLTVRDALLLQGFPEDFPVQGSRSKSFEQVGNAVPPALAAAIVKALVA